MLLELVCPTATVGRAPFAHTCRHAEFRRPLLSVNVDQHLSLRWSTTTAMLLFPATWISFR